MSAAEIIEQIRALPREEQKQVADFVAREFATPNSNSERKKSFEEASGEVFSEYRDLLAKLAK